MIRFLFWNLKRKRLERIVANLARRHDADVVMLAECRIPPEAMLTLLNSGIERQYTLPRNPVPDIAIYIRFRSSALRLMRDIPGLCVRRLFPPIGDDIVLGIAHFASKRWQKDDDQTIECTRIAQTIVEQERKAGHSRTVLVGDLNMNPFENGVVGARCLNAAMTRKLALKETRVVRGEQYPFFYNPMWGRFGDSTPGPPGTYYYPGSTHVTYYWYMFDQVLVRPSLLSAFRNEDLEVLTTDGQTVLCPEEGEPDSTVASDHLPLLFALDI